MCRWVPCPRWVTHACRVWLGLRGLPPDPRCRSCFHRALGWSGMGTPGPAHYGPRWRLGRSYKHSQETGCKHSAPRGCAGGGTRDVGPPKTPTRGRSCRGAAGVWELRGRVGDAWWLLERRGRRGGMGIGRWYPMGWEGMGWGPSLPWLLWRSKDTHALPISAWGLMWPSMARHRGQGIHLSPAGCHCACPTARCHLLGAAAARPQCHSGTSPLLAGLNTSTLGTEVPFPVPITRSKTHGGAWGHLGLPNFPATVRREGLSAAGWGLQAGGR